MTDGVSHKEKIKTEELICNRSRRESLAGGCESQNGRTGLAHYKSACRAKEPGTATERKTDSVSRSLLEVKVSWNGGEGHMSTHDLRAD